MKQMRFIFTTVCTALFALLMFSCGDMANDGNEANGKTAYLAISVEQSHARTVFPQTLSLAEDSTLSFFLTGERSGSTETDGIEKSWKSDTSATAYAKMTGSTNILLETGTWNFTLTIKKDGEEILTSRQDGIKIEAGKNEIAFTTWEEATDGTGAVKISLTFPAGKKIKTVQAGLFALDGTNASGFEPKTVLTLTGSETEGDLVATYEATSVPTGQYFARFFFYTEAEADISESTEPLNRWSDSVTVAKNRTSQASRTLTAFNTTYAITYVTPDGMGMDSDISVYREQLTQSFTENESVTLLKTSDKTIFKNHFYPEFYREEDYSGEQVTGWSAKEVTSDQTLYVKWLTDAVHVENAIKVAATNDYPVYVGGAITNDTISTIKNKIDALYSEDNTTRVSVDLGNTTGLTEIAQSAFKNCNGLQGFVIPESVTKLGEDAFYDCSGLTSITIGNGVVDIGVSAFGSCSALTSVTIPNSVTSIEYRAFVGCRGLTSVTIPNSVTTIGAIAFSSCSALTSVTIPNSVTTIGDNAFSYCSALTDFVIPESVTSLGAKVFIDCSNLKSVLINCATDITDGNYGSSDHISGMFNNCTSLTDVIIGDSVTGIGKYTFSGCKKLNNVKIGNAVTRIGSHAFSGCELLASITIPNSVTSIGDSAFSDCISLNNTILGTGVKTIGEKAFDGTGGTIVIPASVTSIGKQAFSSTTVIVDPENTVYFSDSGILYNAVEKSVVYCPSSKSGAVVVLSGVTTIDMYAFYSCYKITSVTIPEGVTVIRGYAFKGSYHSSITLPKTLTTIANSAFENCSNLKTTNYRGTEDEWDAITIGSYGNDAVKRTINFNYTGD